MASEVGEEEQTKHIESDNVEHVYLLGWLELITTNHKQRVIDYHKPDENRGDHCIFAKLVRLETKSLFQLFSDPSLLVDAPELLRAVIVVKGRNPCWVPSPWIT